MSSSNNDKKGEVQEQTKTKTTNVNKDYFVSPVDRIGVSGGTAPFFKLLLTDDGKNHFQKSHKYPITTTHYIGKDLSRAADEIEFYERMLQIQKENNDNNLNDNDNGGLSNILDFAFEYAGVVTLPEKVVTTNVKEGTNDATKTSTNTQEESQTEDSSEKEGENNEKEEETIECIDRELLVLRNLRDSYKKLRLLDLKMGDKTADANWQGKSRLGAMLQKPVDWLTNTSSEGFRLEGFDGMPLCLQSREPLLDLKELAGEKVDVDKYKKKASRIHLQTMVGTDVGLHFLDLHLEDNIVKNYNNNNDNSNSDNNKFLTQSEIGEIICHEVLTKIIQFGMSCHDVTVPQKWIGSSVALGYDAALIPERDTVVQQQPPRKAEIEPESITNNQLTAEEQIRSNVIVNIFDWGRSELLLKDEYEKKLDNKTKQNRKQFWNYYLHGVETISHGIARTYYHRFTNSVGWKEITIRVMDYDSSSHDDFMGEVTIPLPTLEEAMKMNFAMTNKTYTLCSKKKQKSKAYNWCKKNKDYGSITIDISWWDAPDGSRLRGAWRIKIKHANDLIKADLVGLSDPYCIVFAKSSKHSFRQFTSVKKDTLNPVWDEILEIPVAKKESELASKTSNFCAGDCTILRNTLINCGMKINDRYPLQNVFGTSNTTRLNDRVYGPMMTQQWQRLLKKKQPIQLLNQSSKNLFNSSQR